MKVLFVRTPFRCFWGRTPGYPLSIGLLAAYIRDRLETVGVEFLDFEFMNVFRNPSRERDRISLLSNYLVSEYARIMACQRYWEAVHTKGSPIWEEMCDAILAKSPDIVAIQCYTVNMTSVKILCNCLKRRTEKIKIVLGGPHIALRAEETIRSLESVDYCIAENALAVFPRLILAENHGVSERIDKIPGLWYRKNGRCRQGSGEPAVLDINALPFADRLLGNTDGYAPMQHIFTSLGCAWRCAYCSAHRINQGRVLFRSMENVVQELRQLNAQGFRNFRITDDTFTYSRERVEQFVSLVKSSGLSHLSFCFGARVDTINRKLLETVSGLNVSYISLGVEAGANRILKDVMNKKVTAQDAIDAFRLLHQYRFRTWAFFMLGNPGETKAEMTASYNLMKTIKPSEALLGTAAPLPETAYETYARQKGMIFTIDNYHKMSTCSPFTHNLSAVPDEELDVIYRKFLRRILHIRNKDRLRRWFRLLVVNPVQPLRFIRRKIVFFSKFDK